MFTGLYTGAIVVKLRPRYIKDYFWRSRFRVILRWIIEIAIVVALAFAVTFFFGHRVVVVNASMEPTLNAGDEVLVNRLAYVFASPKRGDIVAFRATDDANAAVEVMRVIALPGETVRITEGRIYINGELYEEEVELPVINNPGIAGEGVTLKGSEYFMLGDNRNNAEDSRYLNLGNIDKKLIEGKLWLRITPFEAFGMI